MAGTLFTYGANATASPSFFQGFDTIAYSPLDYTSPVTLTLSEAGTVDLTTQLQGRGVTLTAAAAGNAVTTSDGDDTVTGGLGVDTLDGGAGNDTIYAAPPGSDEAASDTLIGGAGNDTLVDYLGATTNMSGGAGNDTIRLGGPQNQVGPSISGTIDGGADLDRLEPVAAGSSAHVAPLRLQNLVISNVEVLDASAGVIATASQYQGFQSFVNAAGRTLTLATAGSVQLGTQLAGQGVTFVGSTGNDRISLSGGADRIEAGEGDDTLIGLGGADQLLGGIGRDTVDYSGSLAAVTVNLALGTGSGGDAEGDTYDSIEAAIGSDFDDTFVATAAPETFDGGAGSDTVSYEYSTAAVTIDLATHSISGGYATGDTLISIENITGSAYGDTITGDDGDNVISGGAGTDIINGGAGNDTLSAGYDVGYDGAEPESGTDIVHGNQGDDILSTYGYPVSSAEYYGDEGNDTFYFQTPQAWFTETAEKISAYGGADNDKFIVMDMAQGKIDGGDGIDSFYAQTQDYKGPHGYTYIELSNVENLYTGIYYAVFTPEQLESFQNIAFSDTDPTKRPQVGVRVSGQTTLDLGAQLHGRGVDIRANTGITELRTSDGDDLITGGGDSILDGRGGTDKIVGLEGKNTLIGGAGADILDGGAGIDTASYVGSPEGVDVSLTTHVGHGGDAEGDWLGNIENLTGSSLSDTLTGDGNANRLDGGEGADTLRGLGGADQLIGGGGVDTADYSASAAAVTVSLGTGKGLGGDAEGDTLSGVENLIGSALGDTLTGDNNANRLDGSDGNDLLNGDGGADQLIGGAGNDTVTYMTSLAAVQVNLGTGIGHGGRAEGDTLSGIENLIGSALGDTLTGDNNANRLDGSDGNDLLNGDGGADQLIGGAGNDTVTYMTSLAAVQVNLGTGIGHGGRAEGDTLSGIENLIGSVLGDTLIGDNNANRLDGGDGNDLLNGDGGPDQLIGGAGNDTVTYMTSLAAVQVDLGTGIGHGGRAEGDTLSGIENLIGSVLGDTLIGDNNANRLDGSDGNDLLNGDGGADQLVGGAGNDTVTYVTSLAAVQVNLATGIGHGGRAEGDTLSGIENLIGSVLGDTLIGDNNANRLDGGDGNDLLNGDGGADQLFGGAGIDTATYATSQAAVNVNLATGIGHGGRAEGDTLSGIENLIGTALSDTLVGNTAANRLDGGLGNDRLTGGSGADTFAFTTAPSASNVDTITDMTVGSDLISLASSIYSALQAGPTPGSLAASSFRYSTQASTSGGLGEIIYNATTGSLSYDADGSGAGAARQFAQVSSSLAISASSFRLA